MGGQTRRGALLDLPRSSRATGADSPGPGAELSPRYPHRTQAGQRWFFGAELRKSVCRAPGPEWEQTPTARLHAGLGRERSPDDREPPAGAHDMAAEQRAREDEVVARVLASFDGCAEPRLRELVRGVVTHLHAFLRDVRLTEEEWGAAIAFLAAAGHITGDRRAGVRPALGHPRCVHADHRHQQRGTRGRYAGRPPSGPCFVDGSPRGRALAATSRFRAAGGTLSGGWKGTVPRQARYPSPGDAARPPGVGSR